MGARVVFGCKSASSSIRCHVITATRQPSVAGHGPVQHSAFTHSSDVACRIRFNSRCVLASACTCAACRVWWRQTGRTEERNEGKQMVGSPFSEWSGGKMTGSRSLWGWNLRPILVLVVRLRPSDNNTHCQAEHAKLRHSTHTQSVYVFLWISEQIAAGISLYNIKLLVFIAENQSVYCAVGAETLNKWG